MKEHQSLLCVGGPNAGQRRAVLHGTGFRTPILKDMPVMVRWNPNEMPEAPTAYDFVEYRAEYFHTPQGDVSFWVPFQQTPLETITLLLETYEQAKR